ncbi:hypothetical protein GUJ93_ZPchr0006g41564 [Zizania palustris]|uniref:Uncharacterized protein n=1 Tax=Zizania palustris TaxID=103762 RepID=A0A8J5S8A3_ZIZPA|nr:hypothetical protein GUJ93_ZPchr0006g41564 [Zizania palustris]
MQEISLLAQTLTLNTVASLLLPHAAANLSCTDASDPNYCFFFVFVISGGDPSCYRCLRPMGRPEHGRRSTSYKDVDLLDCFPFAVDCASLADTFMEMLRINCTVSTSRSQTHFILSEYLMQRDQRLNLDEAYYTLK